MGVALILAAPESHFPQVFRVLGAFVFVSGVITPFIGVERVKRIAVTGEGLQNDRPSPTNGPP